MTKDEYIKKVEYYCEEYAKAMLSVKEVEDVLCDMEKRVGWRDWHLSMMTNDNVKECKKNLISFLYSSTYEDIDMNRVIKIL